MVRIEKIIYEKMLNTAALNTARTISKPRKFWTTNPYEHARLQSYNFLNHSYFGKFLKPIFQFCAKYEIKYQLDRFHQRGCTPEDYLLHEDRELRRNVLWEHINREALHPYHWILKTKRRERYSKIFYGLRGLWVPDWLVQENSQYTYLEYWKLEREWFKFTHDNYYSDMTPQARKSVVAKFIILELVQNFGVTRPQAYDKYFLNQKDEGWYSEEQCAKTRDRRRFPYDLTTSEGKRKFEQDINDLQETAPGSVAPVGQKFDFKAYYAELGV